jgi:hypothetical protein
MTEELRAGIDTLISRLRRGKSVNVNDRETKSEALALATSYFEKGRSPLLKSLDGDSDRLKSHDLDWQQLVRLAQGNNSRKSFLTTAAELKKGMAELTIDRLSNLAEKGIHGGGLSDLSPAEKCIISTLDKSVPTAGASYRQGILDLRDGNRLSYRGTASEFRETLRETLDHLAPDAEVAKQPGFKPEQDQKKPTMKQKVRFVLASRGRNKTQREAADRSVELVESLAGELARAVYNRASLATHVETSRQEVFKVKRYVDTVLVDLLEISES